MHRRSLVNSDGLKADSNNAYFMSDWAYMQLTKVQNAPLPHLEDRVTERNHASCSRAGWDPAEPCRWRGRRG